MLGRELGWERRGISSLSLYSLKPKLWGLVFWPRSIVTSPVPSHPIMKRLWEMMTREPELQSGFVVLPRPVCAPKSRLAVPPAPSEVWGNCFTVFHQHSQPLSCERLRWGWKANHNIPSLRFCSVLGGHFKLAAWWAGWICDNGELGPDP